MSDCATHSVNGTLVSLEALANSSTLAFDIEGSGYHIGTDIPYGFSITSELTSSYYTGIHDAFFSSLLADESKLKVAFNAKYDRSMLKKAGITIDSLCDPMIAAHLLGDESLSLQILVALYLHKDITAFAQLKKPLESMSIQEMADYSGPHSEATLALWYILEQKLKRLGLLNVFWNIEMPLVPVLSDMELNGVAVDANTLEVLGEEFDHKIEVLTRGLDYWSGHPGMNHNSPDQVADLLYKQLGIPVGRATRQGERASVDKRYLELDKVKNMHPYIPMYLFYKELKTLKHSYVDSLRKQIVNGRIHGSFNQTRTTTGRLSCVTGNTMVATPQGYRPISELKKGDLVQTRLGPKKISTAYSFHDAALRELEFSDGGHIKVTPNHRFLTATLGFRASKFLRVGDVVWVAVNSLDGKNKIQELPLSFRKVFPLCDEGTAEFLGWLTAEGDFPSRTKTKLTSNVNETEVREYFASWLKDITGLVPTENIRGGSYIQVINSSSLASALHSIGIQGKSPDRRVPSVMFQMNQKVRAGFLRGLFTGDGVDPEKDIALVSSSPGLAQDVRLLLNSLGVGATVAWYDTWATSTGKHGDKWYIRVPALYYDVYKEKIGYIGAKSKGLKVKVAVTDYKRRNLSFGAGRLGDRVISIVKQSRFSMIPVKITKVSADGAREKVFDLEVEEACHYFASGYITHNSSDPNLQKIPVRTSIGKRIRTAFIAPPGHKLLKVDYKLIELVMMAHQSQDPALLAAFRAGRDLHTETAVLAFSDPERRREAKTLNFKLIYLGGSKTEQEMLFSIYPGVKEWTNKMALILREDMYARTLGGRIRTIDELEPYNSNRVIAHGIREGISTMIQGSSAEEVKKGMVRAYKQLKGSNTRMVLAVHDEVVFEVPNRNVREVAEVAKDAFECYDLSVPLKVSVEVGENWGQMVPIKDYYD